MRPTRYIAAIAIAMALLIASGFAAYTYGESTRKSDTEITTLVGSRVDRAVTARSEQAAVEQHTAVKAATRYAKRWQYHRDNKRWSKRLKKAVDKAEQTAYASGQSAGYSAGTDDGYNAGNEAGVQEGIDKASDELVCSDDLDVALPFCSF